MKTNLSETEGEVLNFIAQNEAQSVAQVAAHFLVQKGWARTTALTMVERLRKKGFLAREKRDGTFVYSPTIPHEAQMQNVVARFVERSLGGSISPLVTYLSGEAKLSSAQIEELKTVVKHLEASHLETAESPTIDKSDTEANQ